MTAPEALSVLVPDEDPEQATGRFEIRWGYVTRTWQIERPREYGWKVFGYWRPADPAASRKWRASAGTGRIRSEREIEEWIAFMHTNRGSGSTTITWVPKGRE